MTRIFVLFKFQKLTGYVYKLYAYLSSKNMGLMQLHFLASVYPTTLRSCTVQVPLDLIYDH